MSIQDNLMDNKKYFITAMAELIHEERSRIAEQGLASKEDVGEFVSTAIDEMMGKNATQNDVAALHQSLKGIVLPGDFEKLSIAAGTLSEKVKQLEQHEADGTQLQKEVADAVSKQQAQTLAADDKPKCDCECKAGKCVGNDKCKCKDDCKCKKEKDKEATEAVDRLEKIAYELGRQGRHTAAYEVEKKIRILKNRMINGDT